MTLNRTQRVIVSVGGCVVFLRLLHPPWVTRQGGRWVGNFFIFSPPTWEAVAVHVDGALLFFQIVAIVFGTALLVWWLQPHQAITQSAAEKTSERSILERLRSPMDPRLFWLLIALFLGLLAFLGMYSNL